MEESNRERLHVFAAAQELLDKARSIEAPTDCIKALYQAAATLLLALVDDVSAPPSIRGSARMILVRTLLRHSEDYDTAQSLLCSAPIAPLGSPQWMQLRLLEMEACIRRQDAAGARAVFDLAKPHISSVFERASFALLRLQLGPVGADDAEVMLDAPQPMRAAAQMALGYEVVADELGVVTQFQEASRLLSQEKSSNLDNIGEPSPVSAEAWDHVFALEWPSSAFMESAWLVFEALDAYVAGFVPDTSGLGDCAHTNETLLFLVVLLYHRSGQSLMRDAALADLRRLEHRSIVNPGSCISQLVSFSEAVIAHDSGNVDKAAKFYTEAATSEDLRAHALLGLWCLVPSATTLDALRREVASSSSMTPAVAVVLDIVTVLTTEDSIVANRLAANTTKLPRGFNSLCELALAQVPHIPLEKRIDGARRAHAELGGRWESYTSKVLRNLAEV